MFEYNASLKRIVDGDTLYLLIDLGFHVFLELDVRLARINAPELLSFGGVAAKAFLMSALADATKLKLQTHGRDKYGRWVGEVSYQTRPTGTNWLNLSDLLLENKYAVPYTHKLH